MQDRDGSSLAAQWRMMMEVQAVEIDEAWRAFESASAGLRWPVLRVRVRVQRAYDRMGRAGAQRNGSVGKFVVVLRRAQLEIKLIYQGWPGWLAQVVAELWPERGLPELLVHEM